MVKCGKKYYQKLRIGGGPPLPRDNVCNSAYFLYGWLPSGLSHMNSHHTLLQGIGLLIVSVSGYSNKDGHQLLLLGLW